MLCFRAWVEAVGHLVQSAERKVFTALDPSPLFSSLRTQLPLL